MVQIKSQENVWNVIGTGKTNRLVGLLLLTAEPVRRVYFDSPYLNKQQLTVIAGQPVDLRCVAVGGSPPPTLDVYLDWLNITKLFDVRRSFRLRRRTAGDADGDAGTTARGLRAVDVTTTLETRRFVARVRDHGLTLLCRSAASADVRSVVTNVTLFVNCQYHCHSRIITVVFTSSSFIHSFI